MVETTKAWPCDSRVVVEEFGDDNCSHGFNVKHRLMNKMIIVREEELIRSW